MIVLSGASASGKTEVAKELAKKYGIVKCITTTTREKRKGEVNGKDYFFVDKETFLKMKENGDFVETAEYNSNYYGSTKDQVNDDKCIVVDPAGLKSYIALKNPTVVTFYLEATESTRFTRMLLRGDHKNDALKRISNDRIAFDDNQIPYVNYRIDSENFSVEDVAKIVYKKYKSSLKSRKKRSHRQNKA